MGFIKHILNSIDAHRSGLWGERRGGKGPGGCKGWVSIGGRGCKGGGTAIKGGGSQWGGLQRGGRGVAKGGGGGCIATTLSATVSPSLGL